MTTLHTYISPKKYGITERKKAELDALTLKVNDAQHNADQFQVIVASLQEKSTTFLGFLTTADANKSQSYNNKVLIDQMVQAANDLQNNSDIAFQEIVLANSSSKIVAEHINSVMGKLIYTAEMINKLSNLVIRKKGVNPLISDELVSMIGTAGKDANTAVALTLVALQSTFAAQAMVMESETAVALQYTQSIAFKKMLNGGVNGGSDDSIQGLFRVSYAHAKANYQLAEKASATTLKQLSEATANLNKAQIRLKSLQSGLAAANAAAMAS